MSRRASQEPESILITGATGFVGRAVASRLPNAKALGSKQLDLTDSRAVSDAIAEWRPQVVIHLAARVGGITANIAKPADFIVDNLRIDANLLAALRFYPPRHLIVMLSSCMYPDEVAPHLYPMNEELVEAGPPTPTNAAYAIAKRALWHGARALHQQYEVPFTGLIASNLYGGGDHFGTSGSHFLAQALHRIESARLTGSARVEFMGTGRALRQYLFVEDLAELVALLVERGPLDAAVNVAPRLNLSIRELSSAVAEAAGYEGEIVFTGQGPDGQIRKDVSVAGLLQRVPEWRAMETSLADGLMLTIDWYRLHVEAR